MIRKPDVEDETCIYCNELTGHYFHEGKGPYCDECFKLIQLLDDPPEMLLHIANYLDSKPVDQWYTEQLRVMANNFKNGKLKKV
jgi:hypothetical protein